MQEEKLHVQQMMQTNQQQLEDKTSAKEFATAVWAERKLAIQEE
jgi:hypothetical protein